MDESLLKTIIENNFNKNKPDLAMYSDGYLIIPYNNSDYFNFNGIKENMNYRDIYRILSKNSLLMLKRLAFNLDIKNFSKLKKDELLKELNKIIIFENIKN